MHASNVILNQGLQTNQKCKRIPFDQSHNPSKPLVTTLQVTLQHERRTSAQTPSTIARNP